MGASNTFTLVCAYAYRDSGVTKLGEFASVAVETRDGGFQVVGYPGSYPILTSGQGVNLIGKWVDRNGEVWDRFETTTVRTTEGEG